MTRRPAITLWVAWRQSWQQVIGEFPDAECAIDRARRTTTTPWRVIAGRDRVVAEGCGKRIDSQEATA